MAANCPGNRSSAIPGAGPPAASPPRRGARTPGRSPSCRCGGGDRDGEHRRCCGHRPRRAHHAVVDRRRCSVGARAGAVLGGPERWTPPTRSPRCWPRCRESPIWPCCVPSGSPPSVSTSIAARGALRTGARRRQCGGAGSHRRPNYRRSVRGRAATGTSRSSCGWRAIPAESDAIRRIPIAAPNQPAGGSFRLR